MKPCNRKKEIREIGSRLGLINIQKRISAPPGSFIMQMSPFPCLATQEGKSSKNGQEHPFHHGFAILCLSCTYSHYHGNGTHDQNKCHQANECEGNRHFTNERKTFKYFIWIGP